MKSSPSLLPSSTSSFTFVLLALLHNIKNHVYASSTSNIHGPISPISNLESSLTASAAHGTVIAIKAHCPTTQQPCVLLLSHGKFNENIGINTDTNIDTDIDTDTSNDFECFEGYSDSTFHILSNHPNSSSGPIVMSMTGFTPDLHHILHHAVQCIHQYRYLYTDDPSYTQTDTTNNSSYRIVKMIVNAICQKIRIHAMSDGGRPFGIQGLIVGPGPSFYTIDPTGNWKYWGGDATAIGKHAHLIRQQLYQSLNHYHHQQQQKQPTPPPPPSVSVSVSISKALEMALSSLQQESDSSNDSNDPNDIRAMIIYFGTKRKCVMIQSEIKKAYNTINNPSNDSL